jgi:hypothetical protein
MRKDVLQKTAVLAVADCHESLTLIVLIIVENFNDAKFA